MSDFTITLVNRCDDDHTAKVLVYQSRDSRDGGEAGPAWQEYEVPAGASRELTVPDGPRYFVGVEDIGPGGINPGKRDTIEVGGGDSTVEVRGSLASGLRVGLA
ncbi:MAG: hypothetical protein JNL82_18150 [Myxococcales bacterium]|nr:hypothetical protein [Myxococcales bacterium]